MKQKLIALCLAMALLVGFACVLSLNSNNAAFASAGGTGETSESGGTGGTSGIMPLAALVSPGFTTPKPSPTPTNSAGKYGWSAESTKVYGTEDKTIAITNKYLDDKFELTVTKTWQGTPPSTAWTIKAYVVQYCGNTTVVHGYYPITISGAANTATGTINPTLTLPVYDTDGLGDGMFRYAVAEDIGSIPPGFQFVSVGP